MTLKVCGQAIGYKHYSTDRMRASTIIALILTMQTKVTGQRQPDFSQLYTTVAFEYIQHVTYTIYEQTQGLDVCQHTGTT